MRKNVSGLLNSCNMRVRWVVLSPPPGYSPTIAVLVSLGSSSMSGIGHSPSRMFCQLPLQRTQHRSFANAGLTSILSSSFSPEQVRQGVFVVCNEARLH